MLNETTIKTIRELLADEIERAQNAVNACIEEPSRGNVDYWSGLLSGAQAALADIDKHYKS